LELHNLNRNQGKAMNLKESLHNRLTQNIEDFATMGDTVVTVDGPYTHIDRGSPVLAVAHLDWVAFNSSPTYNEKGIFDCPQLDDRLGAWVILDLLPHLGVTPDILLTDSEEVGRSTAQYFDTSKQYNWMFEVDRRGEDAVMYQYESPELEDRLLSCGWDVGSGSFSDISYLEHLGCQGVNFGAGYYNEHTQGCYATWKSVRRNVERILRFFKEFEQVHMPYTLAYEYGESDAPLSYYDAAFAEGEFCLCGSWVETETEEECYSCGMPVSVLLKEYYGRLDSEF